MTAALLVRDAAAPESIAYDLTFPGPGGGAVDPGPPPLPAPAATVTAPPRSTAGRAKGGGETLAQRAQHSERSP